MPTVTIAMPCYNHARFLPEAVASVVGQTFADWELVIVDAGSTDDSAAVAARLIDRFAGRHIRLLRQAATGPGAARNAALRDSSAPFALALDADDMLDARFLEQTLPLLQNDSSLGFITTEVCFFGAEHGSWSGGKPSAARMIYDCRTTATALFRRAAWAEAGGFCERREWQRYEDWDFWLRLIERGYCGELLPAPLFWYRRGRGSSLATSQRNDIIYRARIVIDHPTLYPWGFAAWAAGVEADVSRGERRSLRWHAHYCALLAHHAPHELPKALLRPLFKALGPHPQMYARALAQHLQISRPGG